jgi:protein-tyrosine phosphatase
VVRVPDEGPVEVLREGAVPAAEVLVDAARQVLMVCTGNLCRSPLAESLYRASLARRLRCGPEDLLVRGRAVLSAGTAAVAGHPATPETVDAGRVRGLDLRRHRSRTLTLRLLDAADRVFVMERVQRERILEFVAESAGKVDLLDPRGGDVPDPFGRGTEAYARTAEILDRAVEARVAEEP